MAYSIKGAITQIKERASTWLTGNQPKDEIKYEELGFDIIGEETLTMNSDVTDYYVEGNISYQDQISLKPIEYKISGEVGELVYYKKDETNSLLEAVPEKLTAIASFIPPTTKSVNQIRNKTIKIANFVNSLDNIANRLGKLNETENKQQQAVRKLYNYWKNRIPINIRTAWRNLENYVITDLSFTQGNTVDKTKISITFKEFRLLYTSAYVVSDALSDGLTRHDTQAKNIGYQDIGYSLGKKHGVEIGSFGNFTTNDSGDLIPKK